MARIIINTGGSLGDLNPVLLVAKSLLHKNHSVCIATSSAYKKHVEEIGASIAVIRPDLNPNDPEKIKRVFDPKKGHEYLLKELVFPHMRENYEDLLRTCQNADLLISGSLAFSAFLVHAVTNIPWISITLQPTLLMSDYCFPVLPHAPWLRFFPFNQPIFARLLKRAFRSEINSWGSEWFALTSELGIQGRPNLMLDAPFSPIKQIAAFSPSFSPRQKDWPVQRCQTGFIQPPSDAASLAPEVLDFLKSGEPPFVFTLGSAIVNVGERFFRTVLQALREHPARAVLVCGGLASTLQREVSDPNVLITGAQPYAALFPYAKAVVHQGGVGTTGEALRAGVPSFIVPHATDQFDNAYHVAKLGCGVWTPLKKLTTKVLWRQLSRLCGSSFQHSCKNTAQKICSDHGLESTIKIVEDVLAD